MVKSIVGSCISLAAYISWAETLSIIALMVAIASGTVTLAYTLWKWKKEHKNDK
jgi:formate-dependent nitrite reductase membrane component NrfD